MRPVKAGRARVSALAGALLAVPFIGLPAEGAVVADMPEQGEGRFTATLVARHSDKCLDVAADGTVDGVNIQQWTCDGGANQEWNLVATDNGYYTLQATHSGKCLDVVDDDARTGANVQQWTCTAGARNQQWRLLQRDGGYFSLAARHSGKCLDVQGAGLVDGVNVQQWTCAREWKNQQWRFA